MRKCSLFLVVTLVAALFAGCVTEYASNVDSDGYTYEKGTVSFTLPPTGEKVTYTRADAEAGEDDLDNLVIYQFNAANNLEKVYATGNITIPNAGAIAISGSTNQNRVATINLGMNASGKKTFYLVANVNGTSNSALSNGLWSNAQQLPAVGTPISTFESGLVMDNLTDALALEPPLPMSNMIDAVNTGRAIVVDDVTAAGFQEVTLKRRVARFDIVNHVDFTNFEVTGVIVKNGSLSGEILDKAFSTATTGDGEKVLANANGNTPQLLSTDYVNGKPAEGLEDSGWEKSLNPAQFYLYPTTVTATPGGTNTEIYLTGKFKGVPRVYPLTLTAGDVVIEANYVYQIVVNRATNDNFSFSLLKVAPWKEYTGAVFESVINTEFEFSNLLNKANADKGLNYDFSDASAANDLEMRVEYRSTSATSPDVTLQSINRGDGVSTSSTIVGDAIKVVTEPGVLTRTFGPSVYYKHVITITLEQPGVPVKAELTVKDPVLNQSKVYTLSSLGWYEGTTEKPVLVGGKYWAPVNVGATTLVKDFDAFGGGMTSDNVGYYFQWGRNTRFWPGCPTTTQQFASITAAEASDKFVLVWSDYLSTTASGLWTGTRAQGPCPPGWRVPVEADVTSAFLDGSTEVQLPAKNVIYDSDNTSDKLYIPQSGVMTASYAMIDYANYPYIWLGTGDTELGNCVSWGYYDSWGAFDMWDGSTALPVRCVLAN